MTTTTPETSYNVLGNFKIGVQADQAAEFVQNPTANRGVEIAIADKSGVGKNNSDWVSATMTVITRRLRFLADHESRRLSEVEVSVDFELAIPPEATALFDADAAASSLSSASTDALSSAVSDGMQAAATETGDTSVLSFVIQCIQAATTTVIRVTHTKTTTTRTTTTVTTSTSTFSTITTPGPTPAPPPPGATQTTTTTVRIKQRASSDSWRPSSWQGATVVAIAFHLLVALAERM
jgi:hypothetical protein